MKTLTLGVGFSLLVSSALFIGLHLGRTALRAGTCAKAAIMPREAAIQTPARGTCNTGPDVDSGLATIAERDLASNGNSVSLHPSARPPLSNRARTRRRPCRGTRTALPAPRPGD